MFSMILKFHRRLKPSTCLGSRCKRKMCFTNNRSPIALLLHRKWYSKGHLDEDATHILNMAQESELRKINSLFPQPRITLNELASRTPEKIFNVLYKQDSVTLKGNKRRPEDIKWLCSYVFTWPKSMKFERSAGSKRQAAESAATVAVQWLYLSGRMDKRGAPVPLPEELQALHASLHQPITASLSQHCLDHIDGLWNEYNAGIKEVYDASSKEAQNSITPLAILTDDPEDELSEEVDTETGVPSGSVHPVYGRAPQLSASTLERASARLEDTLRRYHEAKTELPIDHYTERIVSSLESNRVLVVAGAAGCGKSSRVPPALLVAPPVQQHAPPAVLVAQPRRLAAISLARRVAAQLNEEVGQTVGYQVRLLSKFPRSPSGAILFCTTGILLKRLQVNPGLFGCTAVVLDEAHTREVRSDLAMALLKRALDINPDLRVLLLSATMDTELMTSYFDGCPVLEVPGRTHPVQMLHLADIQSKYNLPLDGALYNCTRSDGRLQIDCDEIAEVIKAVDKHETEGAILTFLPGWAEIKRIQELLLKDWANSPLHLVLPVHASLSAEEQSKMFGHPSPGVRKVVLATNVAETSVTVPDVLHVIDSGAHRENTLSSDGEACTLQLSWVSRASAIQRAGRAGRVQPGFCYKLYTKEKEEQFQPHSTPEILRVPLQQVVLESSLWAGGAADGFLAALPRPPPAPALAAAQDELSYLGAITPDGRLTRLGAMLVELGLPPAPARALLLAAMLDAATLVATLAALCTNSLELFHRAPVRREDIRAIKRKYCPWSDHVALLRILTLSRDQQESYDMATDRVEYIISVANLYLTRVKASGMMDELGVLRAGDAWLLAAAAWAGAGRVLQTCRARTGHRTRISLRTGSGDRAHISTESVNYGVSKRADAAALLLATSGGLVSAERRALVVRDATLVPPHAVLLFTSGDVIREPLEGTNGDTTVLTVARHKLLIQVPTRDVDALLRAREMLWTTFQYYVDRDPSTLEASEQSTLNDFRAALIKVICHMISEANAELGLDMPKDLHDHTKN